MSKPKKRTHLIPINERDLLCIWAACILREPEPLTRLLKKILKPNLAYIHRTPRALAARTKGRK